MLSIRLFISKFLYESHPLIILVMNSFREKQLNLIIKHNSKRAV